MLFAAEHCRECRSEDEYYNGYEHRRFVFWTNPYKSNKKHDNSLKPEWKIILLHLLTNLKKQLAYRHAFSMSILEKKFGKVGGDGIFVQTVSGCCFPQFNNLLLLNK